MFPSVGKLCYYGPPEVCHKHILPNIKFLVWWPLGEKHNTRSWVWRALWHNKSRVTELIEMDIIVDQGCYNVNSLKKIYGPNHYFWKLHNSYRNSGNDLVIRYTQHFKMRDFAFGDFNSTTAWIQVLGSIQACTWVSHNSIMSDCYSNLLHNFVVLAHNG